MKRSYLILTVLVLFAVPTMAQVDPHADGIGIYADKCGLVNEVDVEVGVPLEVYLLLTRPTCDQLLAAWECSIVAPDNVSVWGYSFPNPETIGMLNTPNFMAAHRPVDYGMANLLMTFIVVPLDSEPAQFYIEEYTGQSGVTEPRYIDGTWESLGDNVLIDMKPYPADGDQPCFTVNPSALPIASATWGGVKALYR